MRALSDGVTPMRIWSSAIAFAVRCTPLVAARPFEDLPVAARTSLLERMDRSRSPLLFLPLVAYKTLLSMMHFEQTAELRALGYPGEDRVRWKRVS